MNLQTTLQLVAAFFGLVGSVILAYSLNRVLSEIGFAIDALSTSIESVARRGDAFVFHGLDKRLTNAGHIANSWVRSGIYCVVASAGLTAVSLFVSV